MCLHSPFLWRKQPLILVIQLVRGIAKYESSGIKWRSSAGTLRQLHPKALEFCSADHVHAWGYVNGYFVGEVNVCPCMY